MKPLLKLLPLLALLACSGPQPGPAETPGTPLGEWMRDADPRFLRARADTSFVTADGFDPQWQYRIGWWYLTGRVQTPEGRDFGVQLTFFRLAQAPGLDLTPWSSTQSALAHFAVSDPQAETFHAAERLARLDGQSAAYRGQPLDLRVDDWRLQQLAPAQGQRAPALHWTSNSEHAAVDLQIQPTRDCIRQGRDGFSAKTVDGSQASYYLSCPFLQASGRLRSGDTEHQVQGTLWLDREWSSSALGDHQAGWDWFALHLDDGSALMLYRMRRHDGSADPASAGSWQSADGQLQMLQSTDFEARPGAPTRLADGSQWLLDWQLVVPKLGIDLQVRPRLADQRHRGRFRYWEGLMQVEGRRGDVAIRGHGYLEIAGAETPTR